MARFQLEDLFQLLNNSAFSIDHRKGAFHFPMIKAHCDESEWDQIVS